MTQRADKLPPNTYDIAVIGAGIHGLSMACESASRGLKTVLVHSGKLGEGASAEPTIIAGADIVKLESLNVSDVATNFEELALLRSKAPHLVRPIPTYFTHNPTARSERRANFGLALYRRLQGREVFPFSTKFPAAPLTVIKAQHLLKRSAWEHTINPLRVSIALVQQAQELGVFLLTNQKVSGATRLADSWSLSLESDFAASKSEITAKALITCTGPVASDTLASILGVKTRCKATANHLGYIYFKRSTVETLDSSEEQHPRDKDRDNSGARFFDNGAVAIQQDDKSLVYVHTFDEQHLCAGPIIAQDKSAESKAKAIATFLQHWNRYSQEALVSNDITHSRWSALAMVEDSVQKSSERTHESWLDLNNPGHAAPLLTLFGSNLIQFRLIAERGLDILEPFTGTKKSKDFAHLPLPGGDLHERSIEQVFAQLEERFSFISRSILQRLFATYGTAINVILASVQTLEDIGEHFGHGLYQREVDYLVSCEWAKTADDVLWKRTRLGLIFNEREVQQLENYLKS
ncbi:MAG: glycerol-3-phosphate dehydrogenase [Lentisphaeria bacterium]|jgi:glycerol-3-phosphate dehydrogenase